MSTVTETPEIDEFLAHFGVKGMKWGKHNASSTIAEAAGLTSGRTPRDKNGNVKKPSYVRELALGTWSNSKKRYTDPDALALRTNAGKLAGTALLTSLSGTAIGALGGASKNASVSAGLGAVSSLLNGASGLIGTGALVLGVGAVKKERAARAGKTGVNDG